MPTIAEARALATARRKATEARKGAEKAAADKPAAAAPKESPGLLDRIRAAFSSEDDIKRIDAAVDAVTQGVADADKDNK